MKLVIFLYSFALSTLLAMGTPKSAERCPLEIEASLVAESFKGDRSIPFSHTQPTAASLLAAHRTGYLPERGGEWQRPVARGLLFLEGKNIRRSTRQTIRKAFLNGARITWNRATREVIQRCAEMDRDEGNRTWMTEAVVQGYRELYEQGLVFSIEMWTAEEKLIAGFFGMISDGHVQGVSKFRDVNAELSEGAGNVLDAAFQHYFASRGFEFIDVEVATYPDGRSKPGVTAATPEEYGFLLSSAQASPLTAFEGTERGQPLPARVSDFFDVFEQMSEARDYRFVRQ